MSVEKILMYPDDEATLRTKSAPIPKITKNTLRLIQNLKDTLATQEGAGLAAPQIGVHKQVTIVRFGQDGGEMQQPVALINPVILEEGPLIKGFDGCLSLPKIYTWDSMRPEWLRFRAQNEAGETFEMRVEGADSFLVHHEIDHLEGIFFLDRLIEEAQLYIAMNINGEEKLVKLNRLVTE